MYNTNCKNVNEAAKYYVNKGLALVLLKENGKIPFLPNWQNNTINKIDERFNLWFTKNNSFNIGIATGDLSGVFVLDEDEEGSLDRLQAQYGELPKTPTVKTAKGYHLYFRLPKGLSMRNRTRFITGLGLDIRANGGQVVAPPSIHPTTGNRYEWLINPDECDFAPAPQWLIDLATSDKPKESEPVKVYNPESKGEVSEIEKFIDERFAIAEEGEGGDKRTYMYCCDIINEFGAEYSDDDILKALENWNNQNLPPWSEKKLRLKIDAARKDAKPFEPVPVLNSDEVDDNQWPEVEAKGFEIPTNQKDDAPVKEKKKKDLSRIIVEVLLRNIELWNSGNDAYVSVKVNGVVKNFPVMSKDFSAWITKMLWKNEISASKSAIDQALALLNSQAFDCEEHKVYNRVARVDDKIYFDLGRKDWGCIEITKSGWEYIQNPQVKFKRPTNSDELPLPKFDGYTIDDLKTLCGCSDDGWILIKGLILDAMKGRGPYLIGVINGEQGSAKSTLCEFIRGIIDPLKMSMLSAKPSDERDLCIASKSEYMLSYDNVSFLDAWLQDALCRASTGSGFKTRALYTNDEQIVIPICAPILLNGIPDFSTASDLLDRSIIVRQPKIDKYIRKDEIVANYHKMLPSMLSSLFDLLSNGLKNLANTKLPDGKLPRMMDAAEWITACTGNHLFLDLYMQNRKEAMELSLDASPLAPILLTFLEGKTYHEATASQLLESLQKLLDCVPKHFPQNGNAISQRLRRDKPALNSIGWSVEPKKSNGKQLWTFQKG